jgi:hypothetical protein
MDSTQGKALESETDLRHETLDRLRHWYEQTKNPLYAWEAIARCLNADERPSLPEWCIPYLREAATNLCRLSWGQDFRKPTRSKISTHKAAALVPNALSFSRQGQKNVFAMLHDDRDTMRDALDLHYHKKIGASLLQEIKRRRNVEIDRAGRIIARGRRLLRLR